MASPIAIRPSMGAVLRTSRASRMTTSPSQIQTAGLSTTAPLLKRHKYPGARDNSDHNRKRGESALRRSGVRYPTSVSEEPLPKPVPKEKQPPIETDPNHGLWQFFQDRETVAQGPEVDNQHGRGWLVPELRHKSWEDLHRLWWVCVKERNRIATADYERKIRKLGFGEGESEDRDKEVKKTMLSIKHVLTERFYVWEDARKLAEKDPEINLSGKGPAYTPLEDYFEEEQAESVVEPGSEAKTDTSLDADAKKGPAVDPTTIPSSNAQGEAPRL